MKEAPPKGITLPKVIGAVSGGPVTNGTPYPKVDRPLQEVAQEKANTQPMPTRLKPAADQS